MVKVKDFVPPAQRREIVKQYGGSTREAGRLYVTSKQMLAYLSEPRTTAEIQARFQYGSLASAYGAIHRLLKTNDVVSVGHGLYIAANAGVNNFNIADLSEHERQERGLEEFNRTLAKAATPVEELATVEPDKAKNVRPLHYSKYAKKGRYVPEDQFLAFATEPRDTLTYARHFGLNGVASTRNRLNRLLAKGKLVKVPRPADTDKSSLFWVQLPDPANPPKPVAQKRKYTSKATTPGNFNEPAPEPVKIEDDIRRLFPELNLDVERLVMQYAWENDDVDARATKEVLRDFVKWVKAKEAK